MYNGAYLLINRGPDAPIEANYFGIITKSVQSEGKHVRDCEKSFRR